MNNILLTGAKGQLGSELAALNGKQGLLLTDVDELDICHPEAVQAYFQSHRPKACINAAAYTAVDKAESEEELAFRINAEGAANLAKACHKAAIPFFHVSTDFVFSGDKASPYREEDPLDPLNVYGESKAEGEYRVLSLHDQCVVIRTSWLYSSYGNNFVKTMLRLGKEKEELRVVSDQEGSPTYARDLAKGILAMIAHYEEQREFEWGIYHFANRGTTSWHGFAQAIMEAAGLACKVHPIPASEYPTPAKRPSYSVLDTAKISRYLGLEIPHWRDSLKECITLINE